MICKYFLPFCGLFFHFLDDAFLHSVSLNFNVSHKKGEQICVMKIKWNKGHESTL